MSLTEGKNREVRRICEHLGWTVSRLIRIAYGPFQLGDLPSGAVEECPARCCGSSWAAGRNTRPHPDPPPQAGEGENGGDRLVSRGAGMDSGAAGISIGACMAEALTQPPRHPYQTFLNFPLVTDLDRLDAHVAILGLPYGAPYRMSEVTNDQTNAPTAVRAASERISMGLDRWDFDIGGTPFDSQPIRVVDCGAGIAHPPDPPP